MIIQSEYWERNEIDNRRSSTHKVIEIFAKSKINEIKKLIPINHTLKMLEVGAGNGFFSFYFDQICDLTAVDYSKKMLHLNPVKNKKIMDANNLGFEDNSFDIVFESNMLHHLDNVKRVIGEMSRVSKKYVIFIEPNILNLLVYLFGLFNTAERQLLKFSKSYMYNLLNEANLKVIRSFSHGVILPNKTPLCLINVLKYFDKKIPLLGFDNIYICEKKVLFLKIPGNPTNNSTGKNIKNKKT